MINFNTIQDIYIYYDYVIKYMYVGTFTFGIKNINT